MCGVRYFACRQISVGLRGDALEDLKRTSMNVSPPRYRTSLAYIAASLLLAVASGSAFAQHSIAPRGAGGTLNAGPHADAGPQFDGGPRVAAVPGRSFRYGGFARPMAYRGGGYVPPHERAIAGQVVSESHAFAGEGQTIYEGGGEMIVDGLGHGSCAECESCGGGCGECQKYLPCPMLSSKSLSVGAGVVGFKNAANRGSSGSFGFNENVNWSLRLPCLDRAGINGQFGARGVHTELHESVLTTDKRNQFFVTGGLYRRVDWGLQFGAVLDYLRDDWYTQPNISQIRLETSWVFPEAHEIGFRLSEATSSQVLPGTFNLGGVPTTTTDTWEAVDTYRFFYRFRSEIFPAARGEVNGGLTSAGDGILGANAVMPLGPWVALQSQFTYLIPEQDSPAGGQPGESEAWNLGFGMVFYPGGERNVNLSRYDAPLFDVAGNGDLIMDRR
jgi:hypothetical protein